MKKIRLKCFFLDRKDVRDPETHAAIGKMAGIVGIVCNCLLTVFKLAVGISAGSSAIVADGVNNLSDAASSAVTLLGFRLSGRPADSDHPYGHARYEYLSGLAVAFFILLMGVELVKNSVEKILNPISFRIDWITFLILLISVAIKLWMAFFYGKWGKAIRSPALIAVSADSRNDVIATGGVLLACLLNFFFPEIKVDGYVGLAIALFILYSGIGIGKSAVSPLLGQKADPALKEQILQLVQSREKVLGVHDLLIHDYGPGKIYASVHVEVSAKEDPLYCHNLLDEIEREALERARVHLVIHCDPVEENDAEQKEILSFLEECIFKMDERFSIHDLRIVREGEEKRLTFDLSLPYSMKKDRRQIKKRIDDALLEAGKNYTTFIYFDGNESFP